jgi:hypothetical protein
VPDIVVHLLEVSAAAISAQTSQSPHWPAPVSEAAVVCLRAQKGRAPSSGRSPFTSLHHFNVMSYQPERIRQLNDEARMFLTDGTIFITNGVAALPIDDQLRRVPLLMFSIRPS